MLSVSSSRIKQSKKLLDNLIFSELVYVCTQGVKYRYHHSLQTNKNKKNREVALSMP